MWLATLRAKLLSFELLQATATATARDFPACSAKQVRKWGENHVSGHVKFKYKINSFD